METITLQTKQDLDIYVNPQRQNILHRMRITGEPVTPKQLSDQIGVSPSSIQHHIKKLLSIGIVALDHTEMIHGIVARYYRLVPKAISIGLALEDSHQEQRMAIMQNAMTELFSGFVNYCETGYPSRNPDEQFGDMCYGILHLEPEKARELYTLVHDFIQQHETKTPTSRAWEYGLIAYPVDEPRP